MTPFAARFRLTALIAALALAGCAATPPPRDALDAAEASIAQARHLGAADYAPVELGRAQQRLDAAEIAVAERDYSAADRLAGQAVMEAQLAQFRSRAATGREEVRRRSEENIRLKRELLGQGGAR